jgi:hypothetical protein
MKGGDLARKHPSDCLGSTSKHLKVMVEDVGYSKYGVTRGNIILNKADFKSIVVIAQGWPNWALSAEAGGFELTKLVLLNDKWKDWCTRSFGSKIIADYKELMTDNNCSISADIIVSDIDLLSSAMIWRRVGHIYICRRSVRCTKEVPSSFTHFRTMLEHVQSGGVTDGVWEINLYIKHPLKWSKGFLPVAAKHDLSCIINTMVGHGLECAAPHSVVSRNPQVVHVRPRTFHGAGLFPFLDRTAYFIVPSNFSRTRWCRRHLTAEETLGSLDVGEECVHRLTSSERAVICNDTVFIPAKTVVQILRSLWKSYDEQPASPTDHIGHLNGQPVSDLSLSCSANRGNTSINFSPGVQPLVDGSVDTISRDVQSQKATKVDDATIPVYLWNDRICCNAPFKVSIALDTMRVWFHRIWCRKIFKEFKQNNGSNAYTISHSLRNV